MKYHLGLSNAGGSSDDMSNAVSVVAFPDDRRLGFNIEFDFGDTWYISRLTTMEPIEDAIAISNQEPRGCSVRMPSAQIAFVADGNLDVLGDEINTPSRLNHLRIGCATKPRIDFNDDWAMFRPPEFNVRWSPSKVESSQTAQRNISDPRTLLISQLGRKYAPTKDEMRWAVELAGGDSNDLISHYLSDKMRALCEFFDQYSRRGLPFALCWRRHAYVLSAQQIGRVFG
ncbi:hypothetical protein X770_30750 [Mesorhizobium sp. LSJC269B00]|nr:hypothetical protein X770_30750 [Mesorhizobium sp. LSJC269B00]